MGVEEEREERDEGWVARRAESRVTRACQGIVWMSFCGSGGLGARREERSEGRDVLRGLPGVLRKTRAWTRVF